MASGGYDPVAETVFNTIKADGFFLEYDTDRAGGFEPLRFMPRGKKVVLGLVSSKLPALETKADLKRRIEAASKFVPLEDLCLSPQCGFASTHHGNVMSEDDQKKKLQKEADIIANLIAGLQEILEKFHLAPIPEGVTHMHGLKLELLSWETRLMVMAGNEETITALGGAIAKPVKIMPKSKSARTPQRI